MRQNPKEPYSDTPHQTPNRHQTLELQAPRGQLRRNKAPMPLNSCRYSKTHPNRTPEGLVLSSDGTKPPRLASPTAPERSRQSSGLLLQRPEANQKHPTSPQEQTGSKQPQAFQEPFWRKPATFSAQLSSFRSPSFQTPPSCCRQHPPMACSPDSATSAAPHPTKKDSGTPSAPLPVPHSIQQIQQEPRTPHFPHPDFPAKPSIRSHQDPEQS